MLKGTTTADGPRLLEVNYTNGRLARATLPSNWQMFKNLVGAAADAVKGGLDVRGPEETEAVLKICAECPRLVSDDRGHRCGACGCHLGGAREIVNADGTKSYSSQFGKVSLKAWHCPLGKW